MIFSLASYQCCKEDKIVMTEWQKQKQKSSQRRINLLSMNHKIMHRQTSAVEKEDTDGSV